VLELFALPFRKRGTFQRLPPHELRLPSSVQQVPANANCAADGIGGIGQPLSLLLKLNKKVSDLALYDIRGTPGVAADIAHIDTHSIVRAARVPLLIVGIGICP